MTYMNPSKIMTNRRKGVVIRVVITKDASQSMARTEPNLSVKYERSWRVLDGCAIFKCDETCDGRRHGVEKRSFEEEC